VFAGDAEGSKSAGTGEKERQVIRFPCGNMPVAQDVVSCRDAAMQGTIFVQRHLAKKNLVCHFPQFSNACVDDDGPRFKDVG
jgi:hypothetical protein